MVETKTAATMSKPLWYVLKGVYLIVASFVFSVIFWRTKIWVDKKWGKKGKR